ncbi:Uncharacterised protein [Dermatophilus congolensis]|uniref:Uncharacterized protein n=1 Tax=Dermatophilus congolensis TaxID=1863 RepID=A0AA46H0H6_9MICO|nr:Uncharacterised protein [Dermatophilus congolensis]
MVAGPVAAVVVVFLFVSVVVFFLVFVVFVFVFVVLALVAGLTTAGWLVVGAGWAEVSGETAMAAAMSRYRVVGIVVPPKCVGVGQARRP